MTTPPTLSGWQPIADLADRVRIWWHGPYKLCWGRYPQVLGSKSNVRHDSGYADPDEAGTDAYRKGAHWYMVLDRRGREVWSSDHDLEVIRNNPPQAHP